jgi:hypothetical protein
MNEEPIELAPLQRAILDEATVDQLFFDIAQRAQLVDIVVKLGATTHVPHHERPTLDEARRRLLEEEVAAVQLRYRYGGSEWWDTLLRSPHGIEIVRIEHRLGEKDPSSLPARLP